VFGLFSNAPDIFLRYVLTIHFPSIYSPSVGVHHLGVRFLHDLLHNVSDGGSYDSLQLVTIVQLERLKGMAMTVDIMAAVLDLLLAVTLCYLLHKSRTGFKTTDTTITRVMLFTVNTGLMTSICATVTVITFLEFPKALIYVAFYFLGGRLYTNSLLATLNSRHVSHSAEDDGDSLWFTLGPTTTSGAVETTKGSKNNIAIKIDTTSDTCRDGAKTPCFHTVASHEFSSDKKPTNDTAV